MSNNIAKLMDIEQKIISFVNDNPDLSDKTIDERFNNTHYVDMCINILKRMSNNDLIEAIKRFEYIPLFVDYKVFLKKYRVNKRLLKENPSLCIEEYHKLIDIDKRLYDISSSKQEYIDYQKILFMSDAYNEILKLMPNIDLNNLAKETNDWTEKLYYYSFFKNE